MFISDIAWICGFGVGELRDMITVKFLYLCFKALLAKEF